MFCCVQIVATMQRAWNMTSDGGGKFGEHPQAMRSRQRNLQPSRSQPLITEAARRLQARGHLMESPYHSPDKMPQLQGRRASLGSPGRAGKGRRLHSAQSAGTQHLFWLLPQRRCFVNLQAPHAAASPANAGVALRRLEFVQAVH